MDLTNKKQIKKWVIKIEKETNKKVHIFISNAAVAIILTPIAISISLGIGSDPKPFLMAICFGASACFMTPMGYQTNLMVFAPGQYKMKDFIYIGLPLNLIFWGLAVWFIPIYWPF